MPSCIGISFGALIAYLFSILTTEEICLASRTPKLEKFGFSIALCYQSDNLVGPNELQVIALDRDGDAENYDLS